MIIPIMDTPNNNLILRRWYYYNVLFLSSNIYLYEGSVVHVRRSLTEQYRSYKINENNDGTQIPLYYLGLITMCCFYLPISLDLWLNSIGSLSNHQLTVLPQTEPNLTMLNRRPRSSVSNVFVSAGDSPMLS